MPLFIVYCCRIKVSVRLLTFAISPFYSRCAERHEKKVGAPETQKTEEGSARRNIARKHDYDPTKKEKKQHGGAGGKGKWDDLADGSLDE